MKASSLAYLRWAPRILGLGFTLFLALFALDAFTPGQTLWQNMGAFLVHLAPNFLLLLIILLAWRRAWIGALAFPILGLVYTLWSRGHFDWRSYAFIAGPLFLIGFLFLLEWQAGRHRKTV